MQITKKLWFILAIVCLGSFLVLGNLGKEIYQMAPPIPEVVVQETGEVLYTSEQISVGQKVWQSIGGHDVGSVWGHGSCLAPDWSADWLHREAVALLEILAQKSYGRPYADLIEEQQAGVKTTLKRQMRTNTHNPETNVATVSADRAQAIKEVALYYNALFSNDESMEKTREDYAIKNNPIPDAMKRHEFTAFIFWSSWAAGTERPGENYTYTSNWPHEKLIDNGPIPQMLLWSMFSIFAMMAGVALLAWYYAYSSGKEEKIVPPEKDPLSGIVLTASMKASFKFFAVVAALFVVQIAMGIITAHFTVEGHDLYGVPLAENLSYAVTRTWHLQLSVFWIATAWLATGIFIGPLIAGKEPRFQVWGVNFLFVCLLIIVVGSMFGEWMGVQQMFDNLTMNFWFGHQGWEFIELGRFWQIFLFIGLMLWVVLMLRSLWPAVREKSENRSLYIMLLISGLAIGLFYGAGLMWGEDTHMSIVEYWRWWVVHLWVEGIFEVFATVAAAFLFVRLGLVHIRTATTAVIFATIIFMFGGILGTAHHWYFTGTPISTIAFGAMFSALEVVPLVLMGIEAYHNYRHTKVRPWMSLYKWPVMFMIAVAFWNMVGAGLFGFLINPPISLYYLQGMNTTPLHGHGALFGVYGMLALGLMLFCLRGMSNPKAWSDRLLKWAFWSLNIGLGMMMLMSLLPVGVLQAIASITHGAWYARSAEFLHQPIVHFFVWMRVPGDVLFGFGGLFIAIFIAKLWLGRNKT